MLTMKPTNFDAIYYRAFTYMNMESYSKAIADADKALKLKPGLSEEYSLYSLKGYCFFYMAKYNEAIDFLSEEIAVSLQSYDSYLLRGRAYYETGNYQKAILDLRNGLQDRNIETGNKESALVTIALSYLYMDSVSRVTDVVEEMNKVDPKYNGIKFLKGRVSYYKEDYSEALVYYSEEYATDTTNTAALQRIGYCNYNLKNYDVAIKQFKAYDKKEPLNSEINNMISWTLFLQKKYNEALPFADKAILYDKLNAEAFDTRGCIFYKTGLYSKAIVDFNKALQIDSTLSNSYYFRGTSFLKSNKIKEGCSDLQKLATDKEYKIKEGEPPLSDLLERYCKSSY